MSQTTITPHNAQPYVTRQYPSLDSLNQTINNAAFPPNIDIFSIAQAFIVNLQKLIDTPHDPSLLSLTLQMGRPVSQSIGELKGCLHRAQYLLSIARSSLANTTISENQRYIKRVPVGVVFIISPWNFPYLVTINSLFPALLAGNPVLLKPSPQTPLVAETFLKLFKDAGLPDGCLQVLHLSPQLTAHVIQHPKVNLISFTGSVKTGHEVNRIAAAADDFKTVALELGGKDPAYVLPDCDLDYTVDQLVDGAMFNSGQSCCSIERIYVHSAIYDTFVNNFTELVKKYKLGDPTLPDTNLGPVVSVAAADRIKAQVQSAIQAGATPLIPEELFAHIAKPGTSFVAPQVLTNVNHTMDLMIEESFGPIVGIAKVQSDDEAITLMNDSPYGLTASIWTSSTQKFIELEDRVESGTVFMNKCDFLDPALAWSGVKKSGRGVSLSRFGFDQLTRPKSVYIHTTT